MRKNFGSKAWLYPQPVFIIGSYDENGAPDAMNAAWGGLSEANEIPTPDITIPHQKWKNNMRPLQSIWMHRLNVFHDL